MKQRLPGSGRRLKDVLRLGDPAVLDSMLTTDERHRIRGRLPRTAPEQSTADGYGWLMPVLAVALGLLVVAVIWNRPPRQQPSTPVASATQSQLANVGVTTGGSVQQIRLITPNGTQIVWLLKTGL
jgi:hypothetical protein